MREQPSRKSAILLSVRLDPVTNGHSPPSATLRADVRGRAGGGGASAASASAAPGGIATRVLAGERRGVRLRPCVCVCYMRVGAP